MLNGYTLIELLFILLDQLARLKFYTLMMQNSNSEICKVALMNHGFATESIPLLLLENFNISIGEIID